MLNILQDKKRGFLSIIIPTYNEQNRIPNSLEKITTYLKKKEFSYEIIVIDDGSTDGCTAFVKEFIRSEGHSNINLLINNKNRGKGFSVRRGVLEAKGENILISDADLSAPIEELNRLIPWISKGYDVVIGSRGLNGSTIKNHLPFFRILAGRIFCFLVKEVMVRELKKIRDTQCGFKLFKREAAKDIFFKQRSTGFCFDVEILYIAKRQGYKIKEVPVHWSYISGSKVRLFKDSLHMFKELILIRLRNRFKKERGQATF